MHGRLLFALCRSCCEEMQQCDCNHEDPKMREFTGTWVADELRKAVELGYSITKIYIICQYEITQYNQIDGSGGLFAEYVNTFLKIKQEASGWPSWCTDEATKLQYIEQYRLDEGITLAKNNIEKNSGLRAVAKLCLNSFWGKFGQRSNLKQTEVVKSRESLLKLLTCPERDVNDILAINDKILYVNWQYKDETVTPAPHTSVVIAAYTTAHARLELYNYLRRLGDRVLYYDTDSCIFVSHDDAPDEYKPFVGSKLGDMTDKLCGYGENTYISNFVSGGPKFYAYTAVTPNKDDKIECCKVKGISLNFSNGVKINFDSIKNLINDAFATEDHESEKMNDECSKIRLKFKAIRRTKMHEVLTREESKTCCVVLKKRRYLTSRKSLPFGYKNN
ncbi:uncharacterized protein LOC116416620 isoform X2 [Nasonia vitripennis]|uniref:DNA-directed DNA polymerase n=1 Tax=Nasonia vitripennis TaxID=7425 RepID=A0A7M7Q6C2_NASVI|nr:uncharacterized protein LOC116416620 isoform X2 [Nasonia vitripennis]